MLAGGSGFCVMSQSMQMTEVLFVTWQALDVRTETTIFAAFSTSSFTPFRNENRFIIQAID